LRGLRLRLVVDSGFFARATGGSLHRGNDK